MKLATKAVVGMRKDKTCEVVSPLHLSTICAQSTPGEVSLFEYGRIDNPTRTHVESELALLENKKHAVLFSSGMAAINAIFSTLKTGDQVICSENVYDGTRRLIEKIFTKFGVKTIFVENEDLVAEFVNEKTRLVFFETVSNPLLTITNIKRLKKHVCGFDLKLVIDATFSTPFCIDPIALGADATIHSTTKFLSGHHDSTGGVVITNNSEVFEEIKSIREINGSILSPFNCFLLSRGLRTFHVRLKIQCENAQKFVKWLVKEDSIEQVIFPGLTTHPQHRLAKKQMNSFGSMITIKVKTSKCKAFFDKLKIVKITQSLGGFGTTIQIPRMMMDLTSPTKTLDEKGITNNLIRISVGLEDIEDLIKDFRQALS